jgi:hypothetical protein
MMLNLLQDVALNQREGSFQQCNDAAPAAPASPPSADLIGLDDLADALTSSAVLQQPSGGSAGMRKISLPCSLFDQWQFL